MGIAVGCVIGVVWVVGLVLAKGGEGGRDPFRWAWIDVVSSGDISSSCGRNKRCLHTADISDGTIKIYAVGYVKLVITMVKYIPQAWTNYKRQSTVGWSITQILMDVVGGVLSIVQLLIDSSLQNDWSGLTGNPVREDGPFE